MLFSVIIPVYNRPDEVDELLSSLEVQTVKPFEVILVEDGSRYRCDRVAEQYASTLGIRYFYKENSGPADARNFGAENASGDYLLFFDSDCMLPPAYFEILAKKLSDTTVELFGGPDRDHPDFTPVQKAVSYAMTSFWTTGGIRGGSKQMDTFYPRTFNMGVSRAVFEAAGGFADMRFGEDLDLSIRIAKMDYTPEYIPETFVYHKRRTRFRSFFKQVFNSGSARIHLAARHKGSFKWIHLLPTLFICYLSGAGLWILYELLRYLLSGASAGVHSTTWALAPPLLFAALIFMDALRIYRRPTLALLSVWAAFVQLAGYGTGLLAAALKTLIYRESEHRAFEETFYD